MRRDACVFEQANKQKEKPKLTCYFPQSHFVIFLGRPFILSFCESIGPIHLHEMITSMIVY